MVCFFCSVLMLVVEAVEVAGDRVKGGDAAAGGGFAAADGGDTACPFVVDQVRALGRADMSLSTQKSECPGVTTCIPSAWFLLLLGGRASRPVS